VDLSKQFSRVGVTIWVVCVLLGAGVAIRFSHFAYLIAGTLIGTYFLCAAKVVDQWEKVAVLRFGKYRGLRGPGIFFLVPIVDTLSRYVDQRVRVTTVSAESTLTRDTVPVDVDAIVFWMVWNAEKAILEVMDFE